MEIEEDREEGDDEKDAGNVLARACPETGIEEGEKEVDNVLT